MQIEEKTITVPGAVLFDMDGLLADTEPVHAECFIKAYAKYGVTIETEEYRKQVTIKGVGAGELFVERGGNASDWESVKAAKDALMRELIPVKATLMPGVHQLLTLLKEAGIPMAVATSSRRASLSTIIEAFDLWHYFDVITTKDLVNVEKPNPAVFLLAAEKLGVDPSMCVVLEDSPKGVIAAHRGGMKCIAVPNNSTKDGDFSLATIVVDSLEKVDLELIKGLFLD